VPRRSPPWRTTASTAIAQSVVPASKAAARSGRTCPRRGFSAPCPSSGIALPGGGDMAFVPLHTRSRRAKRYCKKNKNLRQCLHGNFLPPTITDRGTVEREKVVNRYFGTVRMAMIYMVVPVCDTFFHVKARG
jgi:hypothetical protein